MGAIGPKQEVEGYFNFWSAVAGARFLTWRLRNFEPCFLAVEICTGQLVVEEEFDVGHVLELVEESFVQAASVHSGDVPTVYIVGLW